MRLGKIKKPIKEVKNSQILIFLNQNYKDSKKYPISFKGMNLKIKL
jgi:hypothetical protein